MRLNGVAAYRQTALPIPTPSSLRRRPLLLRLGLLLGGVNGESGELVVVDDDDMFIEKGY